ncbi:hypothetical protein CFC21_058905 [Triticum aestivum]|uniref:DUF6817 domain-containing protein n=3 Tax=Triticum TaxID=4564 RepID=A0A9R0TBI6_TRITD|nr:uncharacterized protein LOC119291637 [Triticum dicoccoides]XP_044371269.1 uncharacterized protein LOC123093380 [Triticum aestivum]KAF7050550.1 hypothetical protein CFC21_058905 [Triticum aestivum]VAI09494.1 unnamed protein product [Triticum turgidum subsp. durum]
MSRSESETHITHTTPAGIIEMATGISNGTGPSTNDALQSILAAARPFLRGDLAAVDPELPSLVSVLVSAGAGECYHKHGTFLAHLLDVYRILRLWGAPDAVARCGLFHSSYSNSYVNLAIFEPDVSRARVRGIVGAAAERLVHLFCVVPRHALMHDDLHLRYTDAELRDHLAAAEASLQAARSGGGRPEDKAEPWRAKLRSVVPEEGVVVPHIRTGEPVALSRRVLAVFVLMTVADFSDQYTDYQDKLFRNDDGRLEFAGDNWAALWPGTGKPGLWMSAMSRLAALYRLIATDEQLRHMEDGSTKTTADEQDAGLELRLPPVFDRCSKVLDPSEQIAARDLYWEAICSDGKEGVESLLRRCIAKNPYVGEPWLVLAQVLLNGGGRWEEAEAAAEEGLRLVVEWGSSWDKRMSWEGWVSWGRVMRDKAKEKQWPRSAWGIINLGLVKQIHDHN